MQLLVALGGGPSIVVQKSRCKACLAADTETKRYATGMDGEGGPAVLLVTTSEFVDVVSSLDR